MMLLKRRSSEAGVTARVADEPRETLISGSLEERHAENVWGRTGWGPDPASAGFSYSPT